MFHAAMVPIAHVTPLRTGDITYVLRRFEMEPLLTSIQKYQTNELTLVPPVAVAVLKYPQIKDYSLKSVKAVNCGAGPLNKEHQSTLQGLLSQGASFTQVWGMTETSCVASKFYFPEHDETGSVGRMMPNLDVKWAHPSLLVLEGNCADNVFVYRIIDDTGKDISEYDTPGELCIRGPTIISSYFDNPEASASSFDDEGYFKTGDIMYCSSKSKKWYIVDRKKELIKVRGFQVAPAEIEGVLLSHPDILDAGVIGVQDRHEQEIEHPRAYVVRKPGLSLDEHAVKAFCMGRLARYKEFSGGVFFLDAIPRNASGKVLKRILRDTAKADANPPNAKL